MYDLNCVLFTRLLNRLVYCAGFCAFCCMQVLISLWFATILLDFSTIDSVKTISYDPFDKSLPKCLFISIPLPIGFLQRKCFNNVI